MKHLVSFQFFAADGLSLMPVSINKTQQPLEFRRRIALLAAQ
jgi:hypothetical protein